MVEETESSKIMEQCDNKEDEEENFDIDLEDISSNENDEPEDEDVDSEDSGETTSSTSQSSASVIGNDEEVDMLLESYFDGQAKEQKMPAPIEKTKRVLVKKGQDYFEVLPEGWIEVVHSSGMPIYLHKQSRVCTASKPYYLGEGSVRRHELPVAAVPCLYYRRQLDKEKKLLMQQQQGQNQAQEVGSIKIEKTEIDPSNSQTDVRMNSTSQGTSEQQQEQTQNPIESRGEPKETQLQLTSGMDQDLKDIKQESQIPVVKVQPQGGTLPISDQLRPIQSVGLETVLDHKRENWLSAEDFKKYCMQLFEFDVIKVRKFKTWAERRKHNSLIKAERKIVERPSLPNDTRLITCTISGKSAHKKDFVMNPSGKSFVCILHEFVQHRDKVQPKYHYQELKNAVTPYSATAAIGGQQYGVGYGKSKKDAKEEAAKKTIEIIIPDFKTLTQTPGNEKRLSSCETEQGLKFFDNIKIDDNRVSDLCTKAGLQSPYQILVESLKRNGTSDTEIKHSVKILKHHKNIYTMKAGDYEASAECKNKREGKQKAAQIMLKKLHPQVTSWGAMMLLYGRGSCKTPREKKEEEQEITELQGSASPNKPNYAILNKLKEEMTKLKY